MGIKSSNMRIRTVICGSAFLLLAVSTGCMQKQAELGGDIYRKVPKEVHEKRFPRGHYQETDFSGKQQNCYYDIAAEAYFCQFE